MQTEQVGPQAVSDVDATQLPPHRSVPVGQTCEQTPAAHAADPPAGALHATPHVPQFFGSAWIDVQTL